MQFPDISDAEQEEILRIIAHKKTVVFIVSFLPFFVAVILIFISSILKTQFPLWLFYLMLFIWLVGLLSTGKNITAVHIAINQSIIPHGQIDLCNM